MMILETCLDSLRDLYSERLASISTELQSSLASERTIFFYVAILLFFLLPFRTYRNYLLMKFLKFLFLVLKAAS